MAKFFVTTGTSIREARCWKGLLTREEEKMIEAVSAMRLEQIRTSEDSVLVLPLLAKQWKELAKKASRLDLTDASRIVKAHFDSNCWSPGLRGLLSAEMATLYELTRPGTESRPTITGKDDLVIVAGNTNHFEALLVAAALLLLQKESKLVVRSCEVIGPFAIDATKNELFSPGLEQLWQAIESPSKEAIVVATGGYKGVLLGLLHKAMLAGHTLTAYYMHERGRLVEIGAGASSFRQGAPRPRPAPPVAT